MAYFRVAVSPDDGLAFERIANTPRRGLGDKAMQSINLLARQNGVSLVEGARIAVAENAVNARARNALSRLLDDIERWHRAATAAPPAPAPGAPQGANHVELAELILDESGYTAMWQNDKTPEAPGRLENLKELVKALQEFENLQGFLEHVSLVMDNESEDAGEKVSIMTLHAAKGLEFPAVFLPGWEDGLFPSQRAMDETGREGLEEERRLAYVGITRARRHATISFAANRRIYNQWQSSLPSRFVDELPADHVEVLTPPGLYGSQAARAGLAEEADDWSSEVESRAARASTYNSPGWRRMQARGRERGMGSPREARNLVIDAEAIAKFEIGSRVFHQKFGYGTVTDIEGDKLTVNFEKADTKRVVASYVTAADEVPF